MQGRRSLLPPQLPLGEMGEEKIGVKRMLAFQTSISVLVVFLNCFSAVQ